MSATTTSLYASILPVAFGSSLNWATDTLKLALVASSYSPSTGTDALWSAISSHETSGSGYTAGGVTLSGTESGVLAYASVSAHLTNTAYSLDQVVAAGGQIFVCVTAGTTAITSPTWPTVQGQTVTDGTVVWACLGPWLVYFTSASVSWNPLSLTNTRYGVIYDSTTDQLIALIDTGSGQSLTGPWGLQPDPVSGWFFFSG
jgi:hypothetical protein